MRPQLSHGQQVGTWLAWDIDAPVDLLAASRAFLVVHVHPHAHGTWGSSPLHGCTRIPVGFFFLEKKKQIVAEVETVEKKEPD